MGSWFLSGSDGPDHESQCPKIIICRLFKTLKKKIIGFVLKHKDLRSWGRSRSCDLFDFEITVLSYFSYLSDLWLFWRSENNQEPKYLLVILDHDLRDLCDLLDLKIIWTGPIPAVRNPEPASIKAESLQPGGKFEFDSGVGGNLNLAPAEIIEIGSDKKFCVVPPIMWFSPQLPLFFGWMDRLKGRSQARAKNCWLQLQEILKLASAPGLVNNFSRFQL